MLSKMGSRVARGTLVAAVLALGGEAFADDVNAIKVERREAKSGSNEVVFHLVNQSEKTITAWQFGCSTASPLGLGTFGGVRVDSYYFYAVPGGPSTDSSGLVRPGQKWTQAVQIPLGEYAEPMAFKACAPVLVVFEDTSYEGSLRISEIVFRQRAEDAKDFALTREELRAELSRGTRLLDAVAKLVSTRETSKSNINWGGSLLKEFAARSSATGTEGDAKEILGLLESYHQAAMRHLPATWQARVSRALRDPHLEDLQLQPEDWPPSPALHIDFHSAPERDTPAAIGAGVYTFLALDRDQNGAIDPAWELVGDPSAQLPSTEPNGFRALAVFDDPLSGGNGDGKISAADSIYGWIVLWTDRNHDGLSSRDELQGLADHVTALSLEYQRSTTFDQHGNELRYWAPIERPAGGSAIAWNVFFARPGQSQH